jgi:hypothetical protein
MSHSINNEEYKKGDMVWSELKGPDQNYGYGEIDRIWYEESINDTCFNFHCLVNGGYRMSSFKKIIKKPTARMTAKLAESRKDYMEMMKNK